MDSSEVLKSIIFEALIRLSHFQPRALERKKLVERNSTQRRSVRTFSLLSGSPSAWNLDGTWSEGIK